MPLLREAWRMITRATGIRFVYRGTSSQVAHPFGGMPVIVGADIAVGFDSFAKVTPEISGLAGVGGRGVPWSSGSSRWAAVGHARFDLADIRRMTSSERLTLYLHEFGHVIGLDHTSGDNIMTPANYTRHAFSRGDLAGLKLLGVQPGDCDLGGPGWRPAAYVRPPSEDGSTHAPMPPVNPSWSRSPDGSWTLRWDDNPASVGVRYVLDIEPANPGSGFAGLGGLDQLEGPGGSFTAEAFELEGTIPGDTVTVEISAINDTGMSDKVTWIVTL